MPTTLPYECLKNTQNLTTLGQRSRTDIYEARNGPQTVGLMNDLIFEHKYDNVSMDTYFTKVKEVIDSLEEVAVEILKPLVVYMTVQNHLDEYEIIKRIILDSNVLPYYETLKSQLIASEISMTLGQQPCQIKNTSEALVV